MRRFRNRLVVGHVVLLGLTLLIGVVAAIVLHLTTTRLERVGRDLAVDTLAVERLRFRVERVVATSRGFLLTGNDESRKRFDEAVGRVNESLEGLDIRGMQVEIAVRDYVAHARQAVERRVISQSSDDLMPYFEEWLAPARDQLGATMSAFVESSQKIFEASSRESRELADATEWILLAATALGLVLGIGLAGASIRRLNALYISEVEAAELARRAVTSRDEVMAIVSHDLRAPLQAISLASSIDTEDEDDDVRRRIAVIERAVSRMNALIERMLELAKHDGGNLIVRRERIAVAEVVEAIRLLFEPVAVAGGITLTTSVATDVIVDADREGILQVLSNLVGNAVKHTPHGGRVTVSASTNGAVRFEVTDTGSGIPETELGNVFQRYWRRSPGGLGLGLYICKQIVTAHGGDIQAVSRLGEGATFWFTIPRARTQSS